MILLAVALASFLTGVLLTCLVWACLERPCERRPGYLPTGRRSQ